MCTALALPWSELPLMLIEEHALHERVFVRGDREIRFWMGARTDVLPVWWQGKLQVVRWGNQDRGERELPLTGWTWEKSVEEGKWKQWRPERVEVPACYIHANKVWTKVKQGVHGVLVRDKAGLPVVYLLCRESTRYYEVMMQSKWMPVLIGEVI